MPEYTLSLLIWIVPLVVFALFFRIKNILTPNKRKALTITIGFLSAIGFGLDLIFARFFFVFPDPAMTLGINIDHIPIEEFIFYITGFWFIIYLYIFLDEWYLKKYNPPDEQYARFRKKINKLIFIHKRSVYIGLGLFAAGVIIRIIFNPTGWIIPGYYTFLLCTAITPSILFYRITRRYVNWPAFFFTLTITLLISVIWEVTLALPRGYWGYQSAPMLGIFIPVWSKIPFEAVTVWVFCTLVILLYEFLKINFFTQPVEKSSW